MNLSNHGPVLVTGASGYVAGWIVKALLEAGATVHAAVRDPADVAKTGHLTAIAEAAQGNLHFFRANLLEDGSYREAMEGCSTVFHTASPFTLKVRDPQKELIDPALKGTQNVLTTAASTPGVRRVVVTSSIAATHTDASECQNAPGGALNEDCWNTTASLDYMPYSYSKTLAEREAWRIADGQSQFRLVTINPTLVIGPSLAPRPTSESFNIVRQMGDGTMRPGAPKLALGAVDVRDVAKAHIAAAFLPEAEGRFIVSGHDTTVLDLGRSLLEKFGDRYPLPRNALPKWLFWIVGPIISGTPRRFVANSVDMPFRVDNSKSRRVLGMTYRPIKVSMEDMFQQMIDAGAFGK